MRTLRTRRVSVGDTPELLAQAPGTSVELILHNVDPDTPIDLGPSDVEAGAGFEMQPGGTFRGTLRGTVCIYGVAPVGQTVEIHVLEADR
jgi:hypothetical protein